LKLDYSTLAAAVSALCALITLYMYRLQGVGFVWTKEPGVKMGVLPDKSMQITAEIPLVNLGRGNIKFLSLNAKKIQLKDNSIENFKMDMDEAFFPPNTSIVLYRTLIFSDIQGADKTAKTNQIIVIDPKNTTELDAFNLQNSINEKLSSIGEVLFILRCEYKDGSWFGLRTKTTVIAMSFSNLDLNYLSRERRKQLNELFH
jgi:hypothetical protein